MTHSEKYFISGITSIQEDSIPAIMISLHLKRGLRVYWQLQKAMFPKVTGCILPALLHSCTECVLYSHGAARCSNILCQPCLLGVIMRPFLIKVVWRQLNIRLPMDRHIMFPGEFPSQVFIILMLIRSINTAPSASRGWAINVA